MAAIARRNRPTARRLPMKESTWQAKVVAYARKQGWRVYYTANSRGSPAGFPDLTLVRRERLVYAELKTQTGKLRPEQHEWLEALEATAAEVYVWRPAHIGVMQECLR